MRKIRTLELCGAIGTSLLFVACAVNPGGGSDNTPGTVNANQVAPFVPQVGTLSMYQVLPALGARFAVTNYKANTTIMNTAYPADGTALPANGAFQEASSVDLAIMDLCANFASAAYVSGNPLFIGVTVGAKLPTSGLTSPQQTQLATQALQRFSPRRLDMSTDSMSVTSVVSACQAVWTSLPSSGTSGAAAKNNVAGAEMAETCYSIIACGAIGTHLKM